MKTKRAKSTSETCSMGCSCTEIQKKDILPLLRPWMCLYVGMV